MIKSDYINTIIIPVCDMPNFLAVCIKRLINHSKLRHKIIIVGSKIDSGAKDFIIDSATLRSYQKYKNVVDYLSQNKSLLDENDITYVDCTSEISEFTKEYRAGNIPTGKPVKPEQIIDDGVFVAFKNNFGLKLVETEYVINNWDTDFYAGHNWDVGLFRQAEAFKEKDGLYMFIPCHVQPFYFDVVPNYTDIWEDTKHIVCYTLSIPTSNKNEHCAFVTGKQWDDFITKWSQDEHIIEKPGDRIRLHWVPILYRTDEFKQHVKGYNYQGVCYDLEIDNRCGELGFMKVCPKNSFILHKGWIPYDSNEM